MSVYNEKTKTTTYMTQDRRYMTKEQFTNEMFETIGGLRRIIESSVNGDPYSDERLDALTIYLMTFTLDYDEFESLLKQWDDEIEELTEAITNTKKLNMKLFRLKIRMIARCMEIFDNYIGFKQKQVIMTVKDGETAKYANELDGTYSAKMFATGDPCCTNPEPEDDE